jgi:hypothetical protein
MQQFEQTEWYAPIINAVKMDPGFNKMNNGGIPDGASMDFLQKLYVLGTQHHGY